MSILIEGLQSALLPCSLVILILGLVTALLARWNAVPALAGFIIMSLFGAWLRFTGTIDQFSNPTITSLILISVVICLVPLVAERPIAATIAGALIGWASSQLWVPCVGDKFGQLINDLSSSSIGDFITFSFYMLGVISPLIALAAVYFLIPEAPFQKVERLVGFLGGAALVLIAVLILVGEHDRIIGELYRLSL